MINMCTYVEKWQGGSNIRLKGGGVGGTLVSGVTGIPLLYYWVSYHYGFF